MIHSLKCIRPFFDDVCSERKSFEVRKDDRGFELGDFLLLREYLPENQAFTGRSFACKIVYIYRGEAGGLQDGYVVLGIQRWKLPATEGALIWEMVSDIRESEPVPA